MATGGKLLNEGRAEKLLAKILPEVSCTREDGDRNPSPPPFKVPDGLRTLLNELSKEVYIAIELVLPLYIHTDRNILWL